MGANYIILIKRKKNAYSDIWRAIIWQYFPLLHDLNKNKSISLNWIGCHADCGHRHIRKPTDIWWGTEHVYVQEQGMNAHSSHYREFDCWRDISRRKQNILAILSRFTSFKRQKTKWRKKWSWISVLKHRTFEAGLEKIKRQAW